MSVMVDIRSLHRSLGPSGSGGPTRLSDEPVSALDPGLVGEVLDVIKDLTDQRTTMIVGTHGTGFAREAADTVVCTVVFMDDGRIVEQGAPAEVLGNPRPEPARAPLPKVL